MTNEQTPSTGAAAHALRFVHRWEPRPGATRTLLLLHGTGGDEHDLIPLGDLIDPSANLLSPRGQVLEQGMPRFFKRLAEGVFDLDDLRLRAGYLADFIRDAAQHYGVPLESITAVGFSNGANIAAAVMLLHPGVLSSAVLLRAMMPLEPESAPPLAGARVLLAAGEMDPLTTPARSEAFARALEGYGASVTLRWIPTGHQLTRADVDAAREWLAG